MGKINKKVLVLAVFLFGISVFGVDSASAQTSCLSYASGSTPPTNYGASWDVFDSGRRLLLKADCELTGNGRLPITVGSGDTSQYVYKISYSYKGATEGWKEHPLGGTTPVGDWFVGSAGIPDGLLIPETTSASSPYFFVGYVCTNRSGSWKCGCANSACTAPHWQLQAYKPPSTGGSTDGVTGQAPGFPEIKECGATQNVSGGNISSTASADGCRIIVAAPGSYSNITIDGHSGGVVTVKCQSPGTCNASGVDVLNSDGVIIDGFKITGGSWGINIDESDNVLVRNNTLIEQTSAGVLGNPGRLKSNIQVYNNTFKNDKVGCNYNIKDRCDTSPVGGAPVSNMDYGMRFYDVKSVAIRGNTFSTLFNHAISSKDNVEYMLVEENNFLSCGRTCIELGQEPLSTCDTKTSIEAVVRNNTIRGKGLSVFLVKNQQKVTITNNDISGDYSRKVLVYSFSNGQHVSDCTVKGTGVPANRQIIDSGN